MESLSKAERKRLRKEEKRKEKELRRAEARKQKRNTKIRNYSIALIIIIAIAGFFYLRTIPLENAPVIRISPVSYNFGPVSQATGVRTAEVTISNEGNQNLILNNIETSCMCTSASVVYDGKEGPKFSMAMHGTNPKKWEQSIPPGDSAQLRIYYDPNVHRDLKGAVTRAVYLFSNDPRTTRKEVIISLVQVD